MIKRDTKDTKAKHVVSYTATRNLVKFLALNNLPVQCQRLLLKLLPLLLPCSAAEKTLNFSLSQTLEKIEFSFRRWKWNIVNLLFSSSIGDIFGFLLTVGALQSSFYCWPATNHIYILPVSTLWYIICSLFNHALVVLSLQPLSHNPNFPSPVADRHSLLHWLLASFEASFSNPPYPQKCLKSPCTPTHLSYFPINQWNYFRNPHYRVVTKEIPLTTVVLYVEFIYRSSSFSSHLLWYPLTPPLSNSLDTTTHRTIACITMNWKVLRFSYDCHQRWFVCVKHSLMWGSDPKTSVQTPLTGL